MHEIDNIIEAARRVMSEGRKGILVTVIGTRGSTYRRAGARVVISETGQAFGAVSGGCLERDLAERAKPWLAEMRSRVVTYDSAREDDLVFGMGLGCRGELELLVEPFDAARPPRLVTSFAWDGRNPVTWTTVHDGEELLVETIRPEKSVLLFGGGLDVEPVARLAEQVGWRVSVVPPSVCHPEEVGARFELGAYDAAVVMTHNYLYDLALLATLLPSPIAYIGLLGPKKRGDELLAELGEVTAEMCRKLHNPIGLDLGGETPDEIALSIVAEVQAALNQRSAMFLRDRRGPIHEPVLAKTPTCA